MNLGLIYKFFQSAEYQKGTSNHQGRPETNRKRIWYNIAQWHEYECAWEQEIVRGPEANAWETSPVLLPQKAHDDHADTTADRKADEDGAHVECEHLRLLERILYGNALCVQRFFMNFGV